MAIEIVDFTMKNGDFPLQTVSSPEGIVSKHESCEENQRPLQVGVAGTAAVGATETLGR